MKTYSQKYVHAHLSELPLLSCVLDLCCFLGFFSILFLFVCVWGLVGFRLGGLAFFGGEVDSHTFPLFYRQFKRTRSMVLAKITAVIS